MTTGVLLKPEDRAAPRPSEVGCRAIVGIQTAGPCVMPFGGIPSDPPEPLLQVVEAIAAAKARRPVAVVVSASGTTTDRLVEAVELAVAGDFDCAVRIVDGLMDQVTSDRILLVGRLEATAGKRAYRSEATRRVREILAPLRQILGGLSVLRERTPRTLESVTAFGKQLNAALLLELLDARGVPAVIVDARDGRTSGHRTSFARADTSAAGARVQEFLEQFPDRVLIVTSFPGDPDEDRAAPVGPEGAP